MVESENQGQEGMVLYGNGQVFTTRDRLSLPTSFVSLFKSYKTVNLFNRTVFLERNEYYRDQRSLCPNITLRSPSSVLDVRPSNDLRVRPTRSFVTGSLLLCPKCRCRGDRRLALVQRIGKSQSEIKEETFYLYSHKRDV